MKDWRVSNVKAGVHEHDKMWAGWSLWAGPGQTLGTITQPGSRCVLCWVRWAGTPMTLSFAGLGTLWGWGQGQECWGCHIPRAGLGSEEVTVPCPRRRAHKKWDLLFPFPAHRAISWANVPNLNTPPGINILLLKARTACHEWWDYCRFECVWNSTLRI